MIALECLQSLYWNPWLYHYEIRIVKTRQIPESTCSSPTTAEYHVFLLGRSTSWTPVPAAWNAASPITDVSTKECTAYVNGKVNKRKKNWLVRPKLWLDRLYIVGLEYMKLLVLIKRYLLDRKHVRMKHELHRPNMYVELLVRKRWDMSNSLNIGVGVIWGRYRGVR